MAFNKNKTFSKAGFPNPMASDEEKNKEDYGLQFGKQIEFEWFNRAQSGSCSYYTKRDKYHNLRLYARGEQDTSIYKTLMNVDGDSSYSNYDFRPLQVIPKFVKLIVNQMTERLFDVKAEAVDNYSTDLKEGYRRNLEDFLMAKPAIEKAKEHLGVDISPQGSEDYPETQEEIDLHMKLKYKPAIEIASEEAIKYTLDLNDYDETQSRVIEDITTIGLACIKHKTDPNKGIQVEYVDPASTVHSYPTHRDFKDVNYYGEVKRITINELKRISGDKFNDEELKEIGTATTEWTRYHGFSSSDGYREDDLQGLMVDVLFFTFKSTNTLSYKKKYNKGGGFKMTKKQRAEVLDLADKREIKALFATTVADEGLDLPGLDTLILTTPTKSMGRIQQRIGRIMRRADNKKDPVVIDLVDAASSLFHMHKRRSRFYNGIGCKIKSIAEVAGYGLR